METNLGMQAGEGGCARTSNIEHPTSNLESGWHRVDVAILLLAAVLRLAWLEVKPPHFDEGVNGWFVDQMTATGFYHYEPTNFHGPLHFYVLFVAQTLLGRDLWVLRLPIALASIGVVAFALFGWRRFFGASVCRLAALALAVSPGMVFYGRYAIHETWLVLFNMLAAWGIAGLWRGGTRRDLWATGLGLTGMILTKETWIVHAAALGLATLVFIRVPPKSFAPQDACCPRNWWARQHWAGRDLARVSAVSFALIIFFYSGCLLDPAGLTGLAQTYEAWIGTGTDVEGGHAKPSWYWLQLLSLYEWPALLGLGAAAFLLLQAPSAIRYLGVAGLAALGVYSRIAYKTPWCVIAIVWPFFFVFGAGVWKAVTGIDRWSAGALASLALGCSFVHCVQLNFQNYAPSLTQKEFAEPYVYVQTTREISDLLEPLRWLRARDPMALHRRGHVLQPEHHPLLWALGDFTQVTWAGADGVPEPMDADWLLVDSIAVDRVESALRGKYYKSPLQLRGMSPDRSMLYLRAGTFREFFPEREPEFVPAELEMEERP